MHFVNNCFRKRPGGIDREFSSFKIIRRENAFSVIGLSYMFLVLFSVMAKPLHVSAQTGTVIGEVLDSSKQESLSGAAVIIQGKTSNGTGTDIGTVTDIDGRYALRRVPEGDNVLVFSFTGYESVQVPITIVNNGRLEQNVELQDIQIMGEDEFSTALQRVQTRALTRQRESVNSRNIISAGQIDAFGDRTVADALQRMSGMGHGDTSIRGLGNASALVTLDGQRMATTGDDRSVDLSTISADMIQELEVIKVITPDMDADALSGVININTRRPIGSGRNLDIRLGGGYQNRYLNHAGTESKASIMYGESLNERFSYGIHLNYQRDPRNRESVMLDWDDRTFRTDEGDHVHIVLSDLRNALQFDIRERYSAGFQMTFQPTDRSMYHVQSLFNYHNRSMDQHTIQHAISVGTYTSPFQTGDRRIGPLVSFQNRYIYDPRRDESTTNQYIFKIGGRHSMDSFDIEYSAGWGHGRYHEDSYRYTMDTGEQYQFNLNIDDRTRPIIELNEFGSSRTYNNLVNLLKWTTFDYYISRHRDNEFTGKLDFLAPYKFGNLKFGGSGIMAFHRGDGELFGGRWSNYQNPNDNRSLGRNDLNLFPNATWQMFDRGHSTYRIPWMLDLEKSRDFYWGHRPHFTFEQWRWAEEAETSTYIANEHVYGVYGMGDVTLGRLTFLGGLRMEHSINLYKGRESYLDRFQQYIGGKDVRTLNTYTYLFPNAQLIYSLAPMTNIRATYSRTIGRPAFSQLSPRIHVDYESETIHRGNPDLKPIISDNLDFGIERYFRNSGQFSAGLFYKNITDFVFPRTIVDPLESESLIRSISSDSNPGEEEMIQFDRWKIMTFQNGEGARLYGIELAWQQNLSFLPGFLGNFGTFTNYAYTYSETDIGRRDPEKLNQGIVDTIKVRMIGQRPHVVNAGLSYFQGDFNGQVSYHWSAPSVSSRGDLQYVPEVHMRYREYFDEYRDGASDLSLTLRYRITSNFRIWVNASNILNYRQIDYYFDRDYYPRTVSESGRRISAGLRYTL